MKAEIPDLGLLHADRQNTLRHSVNKDAILSSEKWNQLAAQHRERAERWTLPYRKRRASGQMHPILRLFVYLLPKQALTLRGMAPRLWRQPRGSPRRRDF
jgi:hypothetical protein